MFRHKSLFADRGLFGVVSDAFDWLLPADETGDLFVPSLEKTLSLGFEGW